MYVKAHNVFKDPSTWSVSPVCTASFEHFGFSKRQKTQIFPRPCLKHCWQTSLKTGIRDFRDSTTRRLVLFFLLTWGRKSNSLFFSHRLRGWQGSMGKAQWLYGLLRRNMHYSPTVLHCIVCEARFSTHITTILLHLITICAVTSERKHNTYPRVHVIYVNATVESTLQEEIIPTRARKGQKFFSQWRRP